MVKSTKKKVRPPRIYTDKKTGRKYIKKDGRKYYLNFGKKADKLESVELLKLFLKYLGKPRARISKSKKGKVIISDFNRLEHENRKQINNQIDKLRREKYIKIHEAEALEKRAKEQQEQDAKDREEDLKRQTNRERQLGDDVRAQATRRALMAALPAPTGTRTITSPPLPRSPRPPPRTPKAPPLTSTSSSSSTSSRERKTYPNNNAIIVEGEVVRPSDHLEALQQLLESKTAEQKSQEEKRRIEATALAEKKASLTMQEKQQAKIREQAVKIGLEQKASDKFEVYSLKKIAEVLRPYGYTGSSSNRNIKRNLTDFLVYNEKGKALDIKEAHGAQGFHIRMKMLEDATKNEQKGSGKEIVKNKISEALTRDKIRKLLDKKDWMWKMTKPVLINILMTKMDEDEDLLEAVEGVIWGIKEGSIQVGGGNGEAKEGLMTDEINEIMKDEPTYAGTIPSDKLESLNIGNKRKYGFIMNLDPSTKAGIHWIAIWIDYDGDKSIEIYDPLAEYEPTQSFLKQIKDIVDNTKNLDHYLLLKTNKIKNQSNTSDTCGWHSIKFLKERAKGNRWKFASGYTDLEEDKINQFKKQYGYGYTTFV